MAGYKKFYKKDADIFLKLYKRMLMYQVEEMAYYLRTLPTDTLDRTFDGKVFFDETFDVDNLNTDETWFGVSGLCGYGIVRETANEIMFCHERMRKGDLVEIMKRVGHKVDLNKIGARDSE